MKTKKLLGVLIAIALMVICFAGLTIASADFFSSETILDSNVVTVSNAAALKTALQSSSNTGSTIMLNSDITVTDANITDGTYVTINVGNLKSIALDLNGHKITLNSDTADTMFDIQNSTKFYILNSAGGIKSSTNVSYIYFNSKADSSNVFYVAGSSSLYILGKPNNRYIRIYKNETSAYRTYGKNGSIVYGLYIRDVVLSGTEIYNYSSESRIINIVNGYNGSVVLSKCRLINELTNAKEVIRMASSNVSLKIGCSCFLQNYYSTANIISGYAKNYSSTSIKAADILLDGVSSLTLGANKYTTENSTWAEVGADCYNVTEKIYADSSCSYISEEDTYKTTVLNSSYGSYVVCKKCGDISATPYITTQPTNKSAAANGTVTFTVAARESDATYQWYLVSDNGGKYSLSNNANYSGVSTSQLTVKGPLCKLGKTYVCKATIYAGSIYSDEVTLTTYHYAEKWTNYSSESCKELCYCGEVIQYSAHNFSGYTTTKEPTCTATGSKYRTCSRCNYNSTETIAAIGHDYTICRVYNSTQHYFACRRCAASQSVTSCTWELKDTIPSTCTATGTKSYKCKYCTNTKSETISKIAHSYSSEYIPLGTAMHKRNCIYGCGNYVSENCIMSEKVNTIPATCISLGTNTYKCKNCTNTCDSAIPMLPHNFENEKCTSCGMAQTVITTQPQDTNCKVSENPTISISAKGEGTLTYRWYACYTLDKAYPIDITGSVWADDFDGEDTTELTLRNDVQSSKGYSLCKYYPQIVVYCVVTSESGSVVSEDAIIKTEHDYKETVLLAPTCTTEGKKQIKCVGCGDLPYGEFISIAPAHTPATEPVKENEVAATCTVAGSYNNVIRCTICDAMVSTSTVVTLATGHTPSEVKKENEVAPTCTNPGSYENNIYCETCGDKIESTSVSVPATGHTPSAVKKENIVEATCTTDGTYNNVVRCKVCSGKLSSSPVTVKAKGHTVVKQSAVKATFTANGKTEGSTCSVCKTVLTKQTTVYMIKSVTPSATSFIYNTKVQKPTIVVKDSKKKVIADSNYTLTYSNKSSKVAGTYTVTVTFKGNYSGSKKLTYKIIPAQVKDLKATTVKATSITLTWTKISGAKYYKVEKYNASTKKWTAVKTVTINSITISSLNAGTRFQYRVTALDSAKKAMGSASATLTTGTLTNAPSITVTSTKSKTATVSWKKVTGATKYRVYYSTDGTNFKKAGETTKTTYDIAKLTGGKKVYVKVYAVNPDGLSSQYSTTKNVTVKK